MKNNIIHLFLAWTRITSKPYLRKSANLRLTSLFFKGLCFGGLLLSVSCQEKEPKTVFRPVHNTILDYPIQPVPFTSVQIEDQFWTPRLETNRQVTLPYNFKKCEETGRIRNFAIAGGLEEGEFEGIYFNDSDVFKVIEGASYSLQVHDDPELKSYLDDLIAKIAAAQEEDGYLYTNRSIDPEKAADGGGTKRWTNLQTYHELYNVGHLYEAAVAHYQATGERTLLDVALKNADLVEHVFGPGKNMGVPGHQEIELGLVKLYRVTGEKKYLDLAKFFIDQRGNAEGHNTIEGKYAGKYQQDHVPLPLQKEAVGHAVRAGYFYAAATDVAALTGESAYDEALHNIWNNIVHQKIYLTGGIGAEPRHEGFGPNYELPNATAYTETCAAIALMLWNQRMFLKSGEVKYMDLFERTLYNGFLSGVSFEGNTFFYPNPLEADGFTKFNQGVCGRSPWFDCSCCPVNVVRILPSLPGYIYATKENEVFVNLYMSNRAEIALGNQTLHLSQTTKYPWDGKIEMEVLNTPTVAAVFNLRVPGWVRNEVMDGDLYSYTDEHTPAISVKVNGKNVNPFIEDGYITLEKQNWQNNDKITISFEMPVRKVESNELVSANKGKMALERGPLVFCAEEADNPDGILNSQVPSDEVFTYKYEQELLGGVGKITSPSITAIPYYAWAHRGNGEMAVWLNKISTQ
ncbi:glycoside hydrolase family 127 protein [Eudoraea adriatica]|uniref:glycoside hydrolase family 127 protein n=1 Tax=Eudoraea adriatica TaxID=446681 RepID=UPI00035EB7E4|nr:beta-L-arabinofuranosidase domain-containing protein [Eudoraea adriatica]